MPDITMCADGKKCPYHKNCYRYTAKPSVFQSYAYFYETALRNLLERYDCFMEK